MTIKEELEAELHRLRMEQQVLSAKIKAVKEKLAVASAELNDGDRVSYRNAEYEIVGCRINYLDNLEYYGRKVLKSGALHKNVTDLYGVGKINLIPKKG